MALNINGTTGISGVDGSASNPSIQGTDANTGVSFGSDIIDLNTGGSTRFKIGAAGQLGVAGANYGTSGQALISQGASAAPQWGTVAGGKIKQVVQKSDSSVYSTTSQSYQQATQSDTLTLNNSSNKVLVMVNFMAYADSRYSGHLSLAAAIYRGSVASGTKITGGTQPMLFRSSGFSTEYYVGFCTLMFLDTPGGNTTYSLAFKQNNSSGSEAKIFGSQMNTIMLLQEVEV